MKEIGQLFVEAFLGFLMLWEGERLLALQPSVRVFTLTIGIVMEKRQGPSTED
jgi:hypothetical protein